MFLSNCIHYSKLTSIVLYKIHSHVCWYKLGYIFLLLHPLLNQFLLGFLRLLNILDFRSEIYIPLG